MNDHACVAALREEAGLGPQTFWRLLERFGCAEAVLAAPIADLRAVTGVGAESARKIEDASRRIPAVRARLANLHSLDMTLLTGSDPAYPAPLKRLPDAPPLLYARGVTLPTKPPVIAVVGAHEASSAGIRVAADWARALVGRGVVIVSGLAAGVDAAGHRGALDAGGFTVAVVGSGLDRIGPLRNLPLARRISRSGSILSEYPPRTSTSVGRLLARNRIVVGMSGIVLVVEARINAGGTMDAVKRAHETRIPVCVVRDPAFPGNERLLSQGAHPVPSKPDPESLLAFLP